MIPAAGSMICSTSFITRTSLRSPGRGCGATREDEPPGIDRVIPAFISDDADVAAFLGDAREQLMSRTFTPIPVRERMIPKSGKRGQFRRLGIPSAMDRLVQASLVLVLEPIFEADFKPVSYGFRPKRRAQDAIAEIHHFGSRGYTWVFEADITACFDELSHNAILDRVRRRVGDKRVLALIKAFLKAGIMSSDGQVRDSVTGTPQGGIASPLLANIALSTLDEHFSTKWDAHGDAAARYRHRKRGGATHRIVRYADDFVIMVHGSKAQTDALWDEVAEVLTPLGLRLSESKSRVCHLDEGFDFLGFTSSGAARGEPANAMSTPTRRRRHCFRSRRRCGQKRTEHGIRRSPTSCASSIRCCEDGATISGTACRRPPSATWTTTRGTGWRGGCVNGTPGSAGRPSPGGS